MSLNSTIWTTPSAFLRSRQPDQPVLFFSPAALQNSAAQFLQGFPGLVTYALKCNPSEVVLANLVAAGITAFDVASPTEIELVRRCAPHAAMHYNNPVRARDEISYAHHAGVRSFSVDSFSELEKLYELVPCKGVEVAVRFKLPVKGAAYDFGDKFGADPQTATKLLARTRKLGFVASLTFHPGTQCNDPQAWDAYIRSAGDIAARAGVRISRLNVGGGFASHRMAGERPDLERIFALIGRVADEVFGAPRPALLCEPGRALVADAMSLATRVKALRDDNHVFLNDGIYGNLSEQLVVGQVDRIDVLSGQGQLRGAGPKRARTVFGPTCDSLDRLPGTLVLPDALAEGDYMIFHGMGAYSSALATRFNGYGAQALETVSSLSVN